MRVAWQITILILSIVSLMLLVYLALVEITPEVAKIINIADNFICYIFLFDCYLSWKKKRNTFWRWGWIDILGALPALEIARPLRLLRVLRIMRIFKSVKYLTELKKAKVMSTLVLSGTFAFLAYWVGVITVLAVEQETGNIQTVEDSLWWGITTITTVGYGDYYPVTTTGRIVATILMFFGIGFFANVTAAIATKLNIK